MTKLVDMIEELRADAAFFGADGPCPARIEPGANPRLLLLTGENGGGKSFACKYLSSLSEDGDGKRIEFMRVGMGKRTEAGMHRAFMYGEEDRESTGRISSHVVVTGLKTCRNRDTPHFLCLDEPDVGLSEEKQGGLGLYLAQNAADLPEHTLGLIVVTHSRHVAKPLLELSPWCIRVGGDLRSTRGWAEASPVPDSIEAFLSLKETTHTRMRAIQAVINERTRERQARSDGPRR